MLSALTSTSAPAPTPSSTEILDGTGAINDARNASTNPCVVGDGSICGLLRDVGVSEGWARLLTGIGDTALRLVLIVVIGLVVRALLLRAIRHLSEGIATGQAPPRLRFRRHRGGAAQVRPEGGAIAYERRAQRARTIGSVLTSVTTGTVFVIMVLLALGEFGVNLAPLIAGAGVLGVALGFGAQSLVKDFLSGLFLIAEDQYGVGDVVDLGGEASGTVEAVGLRVTRLRAVDGTLWYVRNGEILNVGNKSQGWARAVLDVDVAYGEDVGRVQRIIERTAQELSAEPEWSALVLEEPEVWGVEALSADAVVVRLVVKTVPLQQWTVARELRRRIKARFDAEGVEFPFAQRTVWLRTGEEGAKARTAAAPPEHELRQPPPRGEADVIADDVASTGQQRAVPPAGASTGRGDRGDARR
ncbi:mechanosensitive ion channel family protein [Quadrisphaera sp. KR29]|uniref:mechanosensitive ion channel family protein n=1 Tax=Quadrisphaera sp. KR29 TaxID=3461391 RepID=UPI0040441118